MMPVDVEKVQACPCGSEGPLEEAAFGVQTDGVRYELRRCGGCGRMLLDPWPSSESLRRAYDAEYYGAGQGKFVKPIEAALAWFRERRARQAQALIDVMPAAFGASRRVLDIGCGSGRFLERLIARGLEGYGTELSAESGRRAALVSELHLHVGALKPDTYPEGHFELISVWHVLEHLPDPDATLRNCQRWLVPAGALLLAVPNFDSWQARVFRGQWFHLDVPRHLFHFTPESLDAALRAAGFEPVQISHLSWRQNLYGTLQSLLNALGFARDDLYEVLKGNRHWALRHTAQFLLVAVVMLPAVLFTYFEAAAGHGGTIECVARKAGARGGQASWWAQ
jgi:SAM-dependent methyltransferase